MENGVDSVKNNAILPTSSKSKTAAYFGQHKEYKFILILLDPSTQRFYSPHKFIFRKCVCYHLTPKLPGAFDLASLEMLLKMYKAQLWPGQKSVRIIYIYFLWHKKERR